MTRALETYDVVIIGAGLCGLSAAVACEQARLNVLIVEAQNRPGGRVWSEAWPNSTQRVDWGAEWIIPALHHEVAALVHANGLTFDRAMSAQPPLWSLDHQQFHGNYKDLKSLNSAFALALKTIEHHAQDQGLSAGLSPDVDLRNYFARISTDKNICQLLEASVFPLTGAAPETVSAAMLWQEISWHEDGIDQTLNSDACRISEGCDALAHALVAKLKRPPLYSSPVMSMAHTADGVRLSTHSSDIHASRCIVAVPLRVLPTISFNPPLPRTILATAVNSNAGRTGKAWATAYGSQEPSEALNAHSPLRYGYARKWKPDCWLVCAQLLSDAKEPLDVRAVHGLLSRQWPEHRIDNLKIVDWPHVPHARASWHSTRAGWSAAVETFAPQSGVIHFSGGDLAPRWRGWMEGALLSGKLAAESVIATLQST